MPRARAAGGFTLVEMLVAIGLMAAMALLGWRALSFVAAERGAIDQASAQLAQLLRAFAQIERDIAERLPDIAVPARTTAPELPLAMTVAPAAGGSELDILRTVAEPSGASHTVRVVYRLGPGGLVRSTAAGEVLLLPSVTGFTVRLYAGGFWMEPGGDRRVRPFMHASAVELAVDDGKGGRYVKVIDL